MKSILPVTIILFALFLTSCEKDDTTQFSEAALTCDQKSEGVVKRVNLSDNGLEYFYYVELSNSTTDINVYPTGLETDLKIEGKRIKLSYKQSDKFYSFVRCEDLSHPSGSVDVQQMAIINVCEAAPAL